tara:strand:- start:102 stop:383 length:282 start_codon:yes stop_codon:yes gene_type:complete
MKTENIIKLTLNVNNFANSSEYEHDVFIEGLSFRFTKVKMTDYNYDFKVVASNADWSLRSAEYLFDTDLNMTTQIMNLIDQIDDINESHTKLN